MDLEIVPAICKPSKDEGGAEIAPLFSGSVTVKVPTMPESYRFKAKHGKKAMALEKANETIVGEDDEAKKARKAQELFAMMEFLADVAEEIQPYFLKVDLKETKSKKTYKTVEDLYTKEELFPIISEIAMKFIQGFASKD